MQLSKRRPLDWFTEIFTVGYIRSHIFSTLFIYSILLIAILGFIKQFSKFTILTLVIFILKLLFAFVVIYLIKLFFEKYKL